MRNFDVQTASKTCLLFVRQNWRQNTKLNTQTDTMKTKHIIATLVAFVSITVAQFATAQNTQNSPLPPSQATQSGSTVSIDKSSALVILDRAKSHVPSEAQKAIELAIKKMNDPSVAIDQSAASILIREATGAEAVVSNEAKPKQNREIAAEDAKALRFAASVLTGTTVTTSSTTSSASSLTMTGASILREGTHVQILERILAEDETLTEATRAGIQMGIKALKGDAVPVPRMWARGLNRTADIAHSLIGNKVHWTKRFGVEAKELIDNADFFAKQDEIALRAAAEAVLKSSSSTMTVVASITPTVTEVQRELVVTVPPPASPVVTTTVVTETVTKKATPKPCKTKVSVAPVNAK